ncbi:hypothetical protein NYO99_13870 [Pelomonas sp. UHG3]|uniref:Uncharacterized protein n=1 Tax=Roseateles hydrophilus TaxID=2975054 RepID=A0ACC6CCL2_9BURK|nr:hypothetical protein [Pelomonas sp. UHG3]MCY4746069.1 hypothetical protein [Pelomonas sp. UHG3]
MNRRHLTLGSALVATLAATAWVATRPQDPAEPVAAPVRRPAAAASVPSAMPVAAAAPGARQPWAEASPAQLAAWQPPPPPPAPPAPPPTVAAPPPPPMAPTVPYQMIGRVVDGEGAQAVEMALLSGPSKALSVKRGDVIDGQWRVEQVSPSGVSLTWLPAKLPQNIVFKQVP